VDRFRRSGAGKGRPARPAGGPGGRAVKHEDGTGRPGERPLTDPESFPASNMVPPGRVVKLSDARRARAAAMLRDEEPADQEQEARAWNDRPQGAA
jgi:hypothetical protein